MLIGNSTGLSLLDLLRWRLEVTQWDDAMSRLRQALEIEAEGRKAADKQRARELRRLEAMADDHRSIGTRARWARRRYAVPPRASASASASVGSGDVGSSEGSDGDEPGISRKPAADHDDGDGKFGGEAIRRTLEALLELVRKPVRWELKLWHISAELHLDHLIEAFFRRRLRLLHKRFAPNTTEEEKREAPRESDAPGATAVAASTNSEGVAQSSGGSAGRVLLLQEEAVTRRLRMRLQFWLGWLKRTVRCTALLMPS